MLDRKSGKKRILQMLEMLSEREVYVAQKFLEFLITQANDPMLIALATAPEDKDEVLTEEDIRDLDEAEQDIIEGRTESLESVIKEIGMQV